MQNSKDFDTCKKRMTNTIFRRTAIPQFFERISLSVGRHLEDKPFNRSYLDIDRRLKYGYIEQRMKTIINILIFISCFSTALAKDSLATEQALRPTRSIEFLKPVSGISEITFQDHDIYKWIQTMQLDNGLIESAEHTNFVSLYDNAISALLFISPEEIEQAERIFDFFYSRRNTEQKENGGGFYQFRDAQGNNGSSIWLGDNAWLLIALNHYQEVTGNDQYAEMAGEIEVWIRSLQDSDGGLWGGIRVYGRIPKVTEGIITAFHAVPGFDAFHEGILEFLKKERWDAEVNVFVAQPDVPRYNFALDLYSLGYLIFEDYSQNALTNSDRFYTEQTSSVSGEIVKGFCFDEDRDVIWLEGTAQMAVAYQSAGQFTQTGKILNDLRNSFVPSSKTTHLKALPYASNEGTNFETSLLWDHSDSTPAVSPNVWYLFAKTGYNPFQTSAKKSIPSRLKFWKEEHVSP